MDLGRVHPGAAEEPHATTVLALRASGESNAVSALHGQITRKMWHALWPDRPVDEVPIGHITNGVHPTFWMAPEARALFDGADLDRISDEDLWRLRAVLRRKLVDEVAVRGGRRFSDPARLKRLLDAFPIQIVYAGKAHPRDGGGLNLSVLDGWWPEAFDGTNGWSIGDGQVWEDETAQDAHDAEALYRTLEEQVVPEWIDRTNGLPRRWIARIRRSIRTCVPRFTSHRMVRDYTLQLDAPRCR